MGRLVRGSVLALLSASIFSISNSASAAPLNEPLRFFEGRTDSAGTMKAMMQRAYRIHSVGRGTIEPDGSLTLVQQVEDEGQTPHARIWHIRQVGPGRYAGSMSDASGPVTIDQSGDGYRFRFSMPGGLSVEQWLFPAADGKSGSGTLTVRKFGMTVARSQTVIHRLPQQASNR